MVTGPLAHWPKWHSGVHEILEAKERAALICWVPEEEETLHPVRFFQAALERQGEVVETA